MPDAGEPGECLRGRRCHGGRRRATSCGRKCGYDKIGANPAGTTAHVFARTNSARATRGVSFAFAHTLACFARVSSFRRANRQCRHADRTATVIRNRDSLPLKLQDDIFLNDVLQTSANSSLGVTFNDATTFNLTANARITVDNYIYEDGGKQNSALFDVTKGTVAFVAAAVAKTGDMKITTPTASLGIRGTTGLVEVPQGGAAAGAHNIKLYPDPDGRVGHIDVHDRSGVRLGSLTQGASGFTIRPGAGGRVTAAPLVISPQQAARDQGVVRQVHAAQVVGRQVVTQQRALRQANPNRTPRSNQPGQPQRQNSLPQRPGSPQQPGSPKQPASPSKPGQPPQPAAPNKPGQQGQPQQPAPANKPGQQGQTPQPHQAQPPGLQQQPNVPGVRQGGLPNRPALQPKRPAPPKGKPPKEKKR